MPNTRLPFIFIVLMILGVHLLVLTKLQFTAWPEMLSYAYLKNNGFHLYQDLIHPYPPLLTTVLSWVFKIFGYELIVLKIITWLVILTSSTLLGLMVKRITSSSFAAISAMLFYLVTQPFLEGNMLWFDLSIVPFILSGTYFLHKWTKNGNDKWLILSGFAFMGAALIKQTAGLFLILALVFVYARSKNLRKILLFCTGPFLMGTYLLFKLIQEESLVSFFNWVLIYPMTHWGKYPNYVQMSLEHRDIITLIALLAPLLFFIIKVKKTLLNPFTLLLLGELTLSLTIVYPRFSYFHLQLAISLLAIFYGIFASVFEKKRYIPFVILVCIFFIVTWGFKVPVGFGQEARFYDTKELNLAQKIVSNTESSQSLYDRRSVIYLLGLNSSHYIFANKLPPKPWTDNFGWYLEIPGVQEQIIERWKTNPPEYIVWRNPSQGNWFDLGVYQPQEIVEYIKNNYNIEGEVSSGIDLYIRKDI